LVLTPPVGELKPAFDPNIYEYTLEVPFTYQSLEWDAIPCDDAAVRVNRKNLGAGGSTTDFFFTVTASDNKTKAIYTVHVTRLKKGSATAQQTTPSGSSPAPSEPETDPTETESNVQTNTGTAPSVSETASETVIHVSTQKDQPADDPFRTAALVLVSAAAGMILVLGAQHVLQKKDGSKD
ncbi:MAG: cadherin-like beta sandwich domain-containing protein, partial [Lachnospiraceae bacterium]|nr:cadherin-like beta sandwich domain-containing protein [Lachnospiraceae bacterium]